MVNSFTEPVFPDNATGSKKNDLLSPVTFLHYYTTTKNEIVEESQKGYDLQIQVLPDELKNMEILCKKRNTNLYCYIKKKHKKRVNGAFTVYPSLPNLYILLFN